MSEARVGINLDLKNGEEVLNEVRQIESILKSLAGGAYRVKMKGDIKDLRRQLDALNFDKKVIRLDTRKATNEIKRLKRGIDILNRAIASGRGKNGRILNEAQIRKANAAIDKMKAKIDNLNAHKLRLDEQFQKVSREAAMATQQINNMNRAMQNVKPLGEIFTSATAKASHIGSALQTLGSGLNRVAMPVRMLMGGTLFAAGYKFINMANEGLSNALERYDTMENYAKSMEALGENASKKFRIGTGKAMTAVENLNEAVLGLPTGLNEIVDSQKRFYSASGDMVKATKVAIAANNAFLASGTEASEKLSGERQLRTLLSVGKLTSAQWQSLSRTMPLAMQSIAKELGYGKDGVFQMTQDINSGKVAVDDFIDAFTRLGTTGVIADAANVMKHSFQGVQSNITNAFSRMGYNLVKTFDEIFQKAYGKDTIDMLYSFRDVIDKASTGIQNWIKSDPDFFIDTLERLKKLDWKGFAKGFGEGMKEVVNLMLTLGETVSKLGAERIGKFMAWSSTLANALTIIGSMFRGGRHIFGSGLVAFIAAMRLLGGSGITAKGLGKLKDIFTKLTGLGGAAKGAEKAVGKGGVKGSLARIGKNLAGIGSVMAVIVGAAGTIAISAKAIKSAVKDMKEISDVAQDVDWDVMSKVGIGFMALVDAFTAIGMVAGRAPKESAMTALGVAIAGGITSMVAGFGALDIKLVASSVKRMVGITKNIGKIFDNLDKLKGRKGDKKTAKDIAGQMYDIYESMFSKGRNTLSDIKWGDVKKGKKVLNAFKGIFDSIIAIKGDLSKLKGFKGMDEATTENIKGLFSGIGELLTSINEDMLGNGEAGGTSFNEKAIARFDSIMASVKSVFSSIKSVVSSLPQIQETLGSIMGSNISQQRGATPFNGLMANLKGLMTGLGSVFKQIQIDMQNVDAEGLEGKLSALEGGITSIRRIAYKLSKMGGKGGSLESFKGSGAENAIGGIRKMIRSLNKALDDADLGTLKSKVESFVSSVKQLMKQVKNLGGDGSNTITVEVTINGKVNDKLTSKIKKKVGEIRKYCNQTVRLTKHVYVTITRHVTVNGDSLPSNASLTGGGSSSGGRHVHPHTGGYISPQQTLLYRAKGGSVFKPKGTDIVPAMLSVGEYVQKKAAVDFWGVRFMQKINNLDINGAMREMSAKAAHYINRGTTINHNTTNNTDFTQNVYTSNPNFAFKRSSRYVGAL